MKRINLSRLLITAGLVIGLLGSSQNLLAHGPGGFSDEIIVTRHFTGAWDQVDQESQGLSLEVIEQLDDSRKAVAYWYTYGSDKKTAWYVAVGNLIENRIEMNLFDSTGVGFMQDARPGNDSVHSIGNMTITFDSCNTGAVEFATDHQEVGSGSFNIKRLTDIMNTHCSGGISDDMHSDARFGEQRLELMPARDGITGSGHARYEDYSEHMEFKVEVEDLPDGEYNLYAGMQDRGSFSVHDGRGEIEFASPGESGKMMLTFDPRGMQIEIHDTQGAVLSSFEGMFDQDDQHGHSQHGDDSHNYDCEMGHGSGNGMGGGMGGGMIDCVNNDEYVEINIDLNNTGYLPDAGGEAEWEMNSHRVEFSVEIEDVPAGAYTLKVGGHDVGVINAFEMHGQVYGHLRFSDPESYGRAHLDFEPRGQNIEVFQGENLILDIVFPEQ